MKVLALDCATQTGFAVGTLEDGPEFGSVRLPSTEDIGQFGLAFESWLTAKIEIDRPDLVAFETPIMPMGTSLMTLRKLYLLAGLVEVTAKRLSIPCFEADNGPVRSYFCGSRKGLGRISKRLKPYPVTLRCHALGFPVTNTDEADAVAVWAFVHATLT